MFADKYVGVLMHSFKRWIVYSGWLLWSNWFFSTFLFLEQVCDLFNNVIKPKKPTRFSQCLYSAQFFCPFMIIIISRALQNNDWYRCKQGSISPIQEFKAVH